MLSAILRVLNGIFSSSNYLKFKKYYIWVVTVVANWIVLLWITNFWVQILIKNCIRMIWIINKFYVLFLYIYAIYLCNVLFIIFFCITHFLLKNVLFIVPLIFYWRNTLLNTINYLAGIIILIVNHNFKYMIYYFKWFFMKALFME